MQKSKLVRILSHLDEIELKILRKKVKSTPYGLSKEAQALMTILTKGSNLTSPKQLDRLKIFKKLFPKDKIDQHKLAKTMSELSLFIEDYLIDIQTNPFEKQIKLLQRYRALDLYTDWSQQYKKTSPY